MPPLRRCLKGPEPYLGLIVVALGLLAADATRPPAAQAAARWYIVTVRLYQRNHSLSKKFIRCRYSPTCSEYSVQAVKKYGIGRGLVLTLRRLSLCRGNLPFGTSDPVL
jgi:putative membrane protein insertion efficiency factor